MHVLNVPITKCFKPERLWTFFFLVKVRIFFSLIVWRIYVVRNTFLISKHLCSLLILRYQTFWKAVYPGIAWKHQEVLMIGRITPAKMQMFNIETLTATCAYLYSTVQSHLMVMVTMMT